MICTYLYIIAAGAALAGAGWVARYLTRPPRHVISPVSRSALSRLVSTDRRVTADEIRVQLAAQKLQRGTQVLAHAATDGYLHEGQHDTTPSMHKQLKS